MMARCLSVKKRTLAAVVLCAFVLLQSQNGESAPTHHLAVSVEGNTPTLIVTSAEIGITPKITMRTTPTHHETETAAAAARLATERSTEVERVTKGNAPKLKGKSQKLQYEKKWQYMSKARDRSKEKGTSRLDERNRTTPVAIKADHVAPLPRRVDNAATIAASPRQNTETTKNTITTQKSAHRFQENAPVPADIKENMAVSSSGSLASASVTIAEKPAEVGSNVGTHRVSAPVAGVSATPGNLPQSTEVTTKPTDNAADSNAGVTAFGGAVAARKTTPAEQVTATPTFVELHDTTAAATTTTPENGGAKKPIWTTTANLPMIAIQIETLPKAITATTMSPGTTTMITETVASTPATGSSISIDGAHEIPKTSEATTAAPTTKLPITENVGDVSQSGPAMSTSPDVSPTVVTTVIERSFANVVDNLSPSPHPLRVDQVAPLPASTPTSIETVNGKTSIIFTTTVHPSALAMATTKQVPTTQKVNTDSGIIFIDDVPDNRDNRSHDGEYRTKATLLHDEAVIAKHEEIKESAGHGGSVNDSGGIIKLIDLEKHDLKSIAKTKQFLGSNNSNTSGDDDEDGHDGVKKTRKKQLTDKHYLPDVDMNVSIESHIENTTTAGGIKAKLEIQTATADDIKNENKNYDNDGGGGGNSEVLSTKTTQLDASTLTLGDHTESPTEVSASFLHHQRVEKPVTTTPILKPVHNGYLGPILMEEKRFTVVQTSKKAHQHHETSIESQLRNGRIVEILAPTSLLEQTTVTPTKVRTFGKVTHKVSTTTTTTGPPRAPVAIVSATVDHNMPMLSTTVFQVPESMSSTTRLPLSEKSAKQPAFFSTPKDTNNDRTESKISDIQVEVYDSTVDSIVASTNFKDSDGFYALPPETESDLHGGTTKPPVVQQERFTQYVVDRADYATQESSATPQLNIAAGKPEPAAIEIHINVSEGIGNESEDLEFSYRQPDYTGSNSKPNTMEELMAKTAKAISMKPLISSVHVGHNESNTRENVERGDEILVVEIIDTGDNSTEGTLSAENINPIFTFRSDSESDVELKDIKYLAPEVKVKPPQISDELFLADLKKDDLLPKPPLPPPPPPRKPTIDRDSDTIFYISNTEVKVGESLPTTNTNFEQQQQQKQQQQKKTRLENQFFPVNYLASTHPNAARIDEHLAPQRIRYEEDIILSPVRNTADSLKIFRSQGDGAPPLDVTYVGESIMEVEQSSGGGSGSSTTMSTAAATFAPSQMPDVIIQPAILPEMSIGVPVIGELPPQIELKEIDFMPDEANQQHSGMYENNMLEDNGNGNGNDVDRLAESSIQYGGDLIDENVGGGGFDGVEGSYPFANPAALAHNKTHHDADYAHFTVNHGISNLRKDELSVDVAGSGEVMAGAPAAASLNNLESGELKELIARSGNETFPLPMLANGSYAGLTPVTERISNATAYSVMEEPNVFEEVFKNHYKLTAGIFVVLLTIILTLSLTSIMWFFYAKFSRSPNASNANQTNGNVANGKNSGDDGKAQEEDISRVARETKMHYNNSERDGVFVVEVARGVDSKSMPGSPITEEPRPIYEGTPAAAAATILRTEDEKILRNHEEIQIHQPPPEAMQQQFPNFIEEVTERSLHQIVELDEPALSPNLGRDDATAEEKSNLVHNSNTGLSQSDLSSTSSTDSNKRYSYGNQELYIIDSAPYVTASPSSHLPLVRPTANNVGEDDDHRSENGHSLENSPAAQGNGTTAMTNDSAHCNEVSRNEQNKENILSESNMKASHVSEGLSNSNVLEILSDSGHMTPTDPEKEVENTATITKKIVEVVKEEEKPEVSLENEDTQSNEQEENVIVRTKDTARNDNSNEGLGESCINNSSILEYTNQVDALNNTESNILHQSSGNVVDEEPEEVIQISPKFGEDEESVTNINVAHPSFPQPIISNYGYDSIISLPDPPSTEEIKQLADFAGLENNQLDSLPPPSPPPPPIAADLNDNNTNLESKTRSSTIEDAYDATPTQLKLKQLLYNNSTETSANEFCQAVVTNGNYHDTTNGNLIGNANSSHTDLNGHEMTNGHDVNLELSPNDESNAAGTVPETPLTPPESPTLASPVHYTNSMSTINAMNAVNRGICGGPMPVAVDVNGS
ncbi:PREDICTED: uncharacterized protein LOC108964964 isoform X2 [Bactrocera latifrons]|nr:PREDICTED: uncharacterized protein LOC108964964 isoform X2 [Bactrocera latifrons]